MKQDQPVTQADKDLLIRLLMLSGNLQDQVEAGTAYTQEVEMLARHRTTGDQALPKKAMSLDEKKRLGLVHIDGCEAGQPVGHPPTGDQALRDALEKAESYCHGLEGLLGWKRPRSVQETFAAALSQETDR